MNVRRVFASMLALVCAAHLSTSAQEPQNDSRPRMPIVGRSVVSTTFGIVAASQPLAARAGVQILERGGNAIDAAIAANATIGLMEPTGNGLGGDLFIIYYEAKSGTVYGLNSSGWAPTGLTPDHLAAKGITEMPQRGIYSVTVPGVAAGWDAMRTNSARSPSRNSWRRRSTTPRMDFRSRKPSPGAGAVPRRCSSRTRTRATRI